MKAKKAKKTKARPPMRFSQFNALTRLSDEAFARIEQAAGSRIRLDAEGRAAILLALQQFEYVRAYEAAGVDEPRRADLRILAGVLEQAVRFAAQLNESPFLWPYIAELANVDFEGGLDDLRRLATAARKISDVVETARKKRRTDPWLPRLLFQLEEQYVRVSGIKAGVTNKRGKRVGPFVRFCDAAISELPESCKPKTGRQESVGSLCENIFREREQQQTVPGTVTLEKGIWPGKARSSQLKE